MALRDAGAERAALRGSPPFRSVVAATAVLVAAFGIVLGGPFSQAVRESVSALGFVVGALAIVVSGGLAAARCDVVRRRRAWQVLAGAAGVAVLGNAVTTIAGGDPILNPSPVGEALVAVALVMTVFGLLTLSDAPFRRARLLVNWLDGVVTGCAVLIITLVLVFSRLVTAETLAERPQVLLFPVLDVAVLTVALLLVIRNQGDGWFYSMVCAGFVLWAVADLTFAVQQASDGFVVGTVQDLMWITAYLLLAASAWHPAATGRRSAPPPRRSALDVQATVLVFALLIVAAGVQLAFARGSLSQIMTAVWVVLVLAVGVRQVLLVSDNQALRDGLERRVAEQTAHMRLMAQRTEAMLTSVGDGIYVVDLAGRISFATPSTLQAVGWDDEQLNGSSAHDLLHAALASDEQEEAHDEADCYVTRAIERGEVVVSHADLYRRADGTTFPVEVTASPLVDDDAVIGAVVVFRDVTERREVDRMKEEFLSIVSHELRTPLTSIRGSLGMLSSGAFDGIPPTALRMLSIATRSSDRLIRLINDILDIERIRSGKMPMVREPVEARQLVETAVREMSGLADAAQIRLEAASEPGRVLADADRIVQTLTNVVANAVKFSPAGSVVRVSACRSSGPDGHDGVVQFEVADQGRGVPPEMLEAIFEPFEQVDSSDSRSQGGTGLGLAISRGIVERHGGRIWAESEVGVGTTVRFALPRVVSSPEAHTEGVLA